MFYIALMFTDDFAVGVTGSGKGHDRGCLEEQAQIRSTGRRRPIDKGEKCESRIMCAAIYYQLTCGFACQV